MLSTSPAAVQITSSQYVSNKGSKNVLSMWLRNCCWCISTVYMYIWCSFAQTNVGKLRFAHKPGCISGQKSGKKSAHTKVLLHEVHKWKSKAVWMRKLLVCYQCACNYSVSGESCSLMFVDRVFELNLNTCMRASDMCLCSLMECCGCGHA